jgi:hypothetical protein
MKQITILFLIIANTTFAQFKFSDLEYIDINSSYLGGSFGVNKTAQFVVINKLCTDSVDYYQYYEPTTIIGYWKLKDKTKIEFHYTEAPSDDPTFIAVHNGKIILEESGSTLHFKGNTIYIEGIGNSYFNKKRKFSFIDNTYKEVTQSFYHIGIKGKLNYPIKIYKTDKLLKKLAYLPKGYKIEVIMGQTGGEYNDLIKVLIKTEFGLIGWFNFETVDFGKPLIDDLWFHGD